mgnify:CR=1 FL=1
MYYHKHNNRAYSPSIKKLALSIGFVALLFFSNQIFFNTVSSLFNPIAVPFLRFGASLSDSINNLFPFLKTNRALIEENNSLKNTLGEANWKLLTYALLAEENKALKEIFGRTAKETPILASVLAQPSRSPYDTLIIDAGLREGIAKGDRVNAFETIAIGSIAEVFPKTSKVVLFSSPDEKTTVRLGSLPIAKEIVGQGGGMFLFTVPNDIAITRGEILTLSGLNQKVVGIVTNIETLPNDSFQTVTAKLPINIFELERVFITHGNAPETDDAKKQNQEKY